MTNRRKGKRLKAQALSRRYQAGERDFRGMSLQGARLDGLRLSGADFSGANIRGASFRNADLQGVNFSNVTAGLPLWRVVLHGFLAASIAIIAGMLQAFSGAFSAFFLNAENFNSIVELAIASIIYLLIAIIAYITVLRQGFSAQAFGSIAIAFALLSIFSLITTPIPSFDGSFAVAGAIAGAIAVTVSFAGAITSIVAFSFAFSAADSLVVIVVASIVLVLVAIAFTLSFAVALDMSIIASTCVIVGVLFSLYVGWRALNRDQKFEGLRMFGLSLAAVGTSFCGAELSGASFQNAFLENASFVDTPQRNTVVTRVCWRGAKRLDWIRLGKTILRDRRIRMLLTHPQKGYQQDFSDSDLRGANLKGANLEGAVLRRAILSNASLENAALKNAVLTEVQAVNTDFTGAYLTGATLDSWNINSETTFENVDCQYVFLREHLDHKGNRDRLPHDPDQIFRPGDFQKFFKEILDEVTILIRGGVEASAFRAAFQQVLENNVGIEQDAIRSVERRGEDVLLTMSVTEETDKSKVVRDWKSGYQAGLKAGATKARLESGQKFEDIAFALAEKAISVENRSEVKMGNDHNQNIDVSGNFTVTANNSVVSLRDISGQVSNKIAELNDEPVQAQLKEMLNQLKTAIETDSALSEAEKLDALEEVKQIAAAGQSPQDGPMKKAAKRAITVLKGMTVGMNETTNFVETCSGLLGAIALLFGL